MEKKRIYEVAKDEGLPSAFVLQRLRAGGIEAKTASSTVDVAIALNILNPNKYPLDPAHVAEAPATKAPAKRAAKPKPAEAPVAEPTEAETDADDPEVDLSGATPSERRKARAAAARLKRAKELGIDVADLPGAPVAKSPAPEPEPVAETAPPEEPAPAEPPAPEPEPEPLPVVVAEPEPEAQPEPEPVPAPVAVAQPQPEAPPVVEPTPEAVAQPEVELPAAEAVHEPVAETPPAEMPPVESIPEPVAEASPLPEAPVAEVPAGEAAPLPEAPAAEAVPAAPVVRRPKLPEPVPVRPPLWRDPNPPAKTSRPSGGRPAAPAPKADGATTASPEAARADRFGPPAPSSDERAATPGRGPGAAGSDAAKGRRRRVVIDAQASRRPTGPAARGGRGGRGSRDNRDAAPVVIDPEVVVDVQSGSTVKEMAEALTVPSVDIIKLLMTLGEMATITQSLSDEAIEIVATEMGRKVKIVRAEEEDEAEDVIEDDPADLISRAPVVTVMGHVDHGKTSLLDAIRTTEVAAGEAGGITQHIGAYQVHRNSRELTFLDTPGHEAFTAMRARGAKITDVAVIVVAADDGVMPQTVEAIDHAKAAGVPFVIAINKMDKEDANPDRVRQELTTHEVIPREWGGTYEFVEVSARAQTGLDTLLETILLVADVDVDPKANPNAPASGTVIESRLDPGRGPVCTVLVQRGTLKIGDVLVVGETYGRVRAMHSYNGTVLPEATPAVPAEILGLDAVPGSGEKFRVVENEREARQIAGERSLRLRAEDLANSRPVSLDDLFARVREGGLKELNLIIKGDVQGSVGALVDALNKTEQTEVRLRVIHTGVGAVTESDVMLASASSAIIIAFNVRPRPEAKLLAEREGVDIRAYRVIYRAIEDVKAALVGMLAPDIVEDTIGQVEIRTTFRASRIGTIAGCYVTSGLVRRGANIRLVRDGTVVHEGKIGSLKRFDDDAREVLTGFECGILVEGYNDVKEGDELEVYELREVARTAQNPAASSD